VSVQALYDITFPLAVPFWALMILAPGWSLTRRVIGSPLIVLPPLVVFVLVLVPQFPRYWDVMTGPSLDALTALFATEAGSAAIWAQFIAFDLFIGRWMHLDARRRGIHPLLMAPVLALTVFVSPLGLLAHLLLRSVPGVRRTPAPQAGAAAAVG
jgi:hypothetical protein